MNKNKKLNIKNIEYEKCSNDIIYFIENYCVSVSPISLSKKEIRKLKLKSLNEPNNKSLKEEIRKINKIKLYKHQKDILNEYIKNKNIINIHSRQTGITTIYTLIFLHELLFKKNTKLLLYSNSEYNSDNMIKNLRYYYNNLPNFIKSNIVSNQKNKIILENDSKIEKIININDIKDFDILFLPNFAHIYNINIIYHNIIKKHMKDENRVIIETQPNGKNNVLYELVNENDLKDDSLFKISRYYWYDLPNKEQLIDKDEIINMLGFEKFQQNYNLKFL